MDEKQASAGAERGDAISGGSFAMSVSIHPTAVIDPRAELHDDVVIGPFCVVDGDVVVGRGTRLVSHVVLRGRVTLGE
ncbi:MAG: hypothetical protein ACRDD1_02955, partial [Planctomycetia bacterium]